MRLADPVLLQLGLALTALALVGLWSHDGRRKRLAEYLGGRRAMRRLARWNLYRLRVERALLVGVAGVALAVASAEPRWTDAPPREPPVKNVVIAIDVSASMQATDVAPTRLAEAVRVAHDLVTSLDGHRVGLLLFAGTGYPLAPPTFDHGAIRFLLSGVTPTIASQYDPGTLMSVGIEESVALLTRPALAAADAEGRPGERLIVVLGDGETGADDGRVAEALGLAADAGVTLHAIGIGTDAGSGMIMPAGTYQVGGPVLDERGERAIARLGEPLLQQLSAGAGGRYVHVGRGSEVAALQAELADPEDDPAEDLLAPRPAWTRYDLTFVLGLLALLLVVTESLLNVTLPHSRPFGVREPA